MLVVRPKMNNNVALSGLSNYGAGTTVDAPKIRHGGMRWSSITLATDVPDCAGGRVDAPDTELWVVTLQAAEDASAMH